MAQRKTHSFEGSNTHLDHSDHDIPAMGALRKANRVGALFDHLGKHLGEKRELIECGDLTPLAKRIM